MSGTQGKIRVLHVLGSLDVGGCERLCLDILRCYNKARFESHIAVFTSPNGGLAPEFQKIAAIRIHQCLYTPPHKISFILRFNHFCRQLRPDVVFCYAFGMHALIGFAARMAGVKKVLVTVQNPSPRESVMRRKTKWLAQLARPFCFGEVACSHYVAADIQQVYGLPQSRVWVVPNGCDVREIHQRAERTRRQQASTQGPVIGMVARLNSIKDQSTLIRAIAILRRMEPRIRLRLIGEGPEREMLEQLVSQMGLQEQVEFLGSRLDVPEQLGSLDVFAFATTSAEGFGIALIEALAAGVPVVATDVGPCREILDAGRVGLLVPPKDPEALAEGIARLLNDSALSARLAHDGYYRALAHYDIRQTTHAYETLFAAEA